MELLDATLREGEQRSGRSYSVDQKVTAARHLDALGVDYIQIGFPVREDGTKEACQRLDVNAKVTGIARAIATDIDAAVDAGVDVVQFSVPTSDLQREKLIGVDREELAVMAEDTLEYARDYGFDEIHFGAMDGFRTDPAYLSELFARIDTPYVGIADTVGVRTPQEVTAFLTDLECDLSRVSVHFHRDLGLGTANVIAAAACGVGKADVTVGGIGERAGNVALEEVVVAGAIGDVRIETNIETESLIPRCHEILDAIDEAISPHKPILGETAYEHESGMHTAAMLDDPSTFEPFDPAQFGGERQLVFGPASGRGAARRLLSRVGADPTDQAVAAFLDRLHALDEHVSYDEAVAMAKATVPS